MVELAMALVLMNLGSTPEVSGPPVPTRPLMFVMDVGGDHVAEVTRQTLAEKIAQLNDAISSLSAGSAGLR